MGRQLAHILLLLRRHLSADVELLLSPALELDSMPLTAYYAYAVPAIPTDMSQQPAAVVAMLPRVPEHRVLTLNIEAPEAWLVEVRPTRSMLATWARRGTRTEHGHLNGRCHHVRYMDKDAGGAGGGG